METKLRLAQILLREISRRDKIDPRYPVELNEIARLLANIEKELKNGN